MIAIASDHGGYALKEHIKAYLAAKGITCQDFGCETPDRCDYPVFGKAAAQACAPVMRRSPPNCMPPGRRGKNKRLRPISIGRSRLLRGTT